MMPKQVMSCALATHPNTREKIMDAAESLIIERGYAGTSLRAIALAAGVNLAATHYHFGSKKGLLAAVFHRRIQPVTQARHAALTALEEGDKPLCVEAIVAAFFEPFYSVEERTSLKTITGLIGRIHGEPDALVKPMLAEEFGDVSLRYQRAFARVLPGVTGDELEWRFHFMIGAMIQFLRYRSPLGSSNTDASFRNGLNLLHGFTCAGFKQGVTKI